MTALLAKLGLVLAEGKSLWPFIALLALLVVLIGGALYGVRVLTGLGYDKAMHECRAAATAANDKAREAETQLSEANREVIIRHTAEVARLNERAQKLKNEVKNYVEKNPRVTQCGLDADGLHLWNASVTDDAALPVR